MAGIDRIGSNALLLLLILLLFTICQFMSDCIEITLLREGSAHTLRLFHEKKAGRKISNSETDNESPLHLISVSCQAKL